MLRRLDSNARPPGYEPDELPTALLRDVVYFFIETHKTIVLNIIQNAKCISFIWSYTEPVLAPFGSCSFQRCYGRKLFFTRISQFIEILETT